MGNGKEYNHYSFFIFEGEYINWKRWNGIGFDKDKNILYELKNGKGFVKEFNYKYIEFELEYKNWERKGTGKEYDYNGQVTFKGEYLNGKRLDGKGFDKNKNILYELKNGKGYVKELINNYIEFEGEYKNGEKNWKRKRIFWEW